MKSLFKLLPVFSILFVSCQSSEPETQQPYTRPEWADTVVEFRVNGNPQPYKLKRSTRLNLSDFQSFLDEYANKPLEFIEVANIDVTGDGDPETVTTQVKQGDTCFIVYGAIYSGKRRLYADTLRVDERFSFDMIWNKDSIYLKLKPYSAFYDALLKRHFIDDLHTGFETEIYWMDFYVDHQKALYAKEGLDTIHVNAKIDSLRNELKHYKGKLVFRFDPIAHDVYIWDKMRDKFMLFYEP